MGKCKYCGTPIRFDTACNCYRLDRTNGEYNELKKQIPPYEVYQAIRLLCKMFTEITAMPLDIQEIANQCMVSHGEAEKGFQWMIENNP